MRNFFLCFLLFAVLPASAQLSGFGAYAGLHLNTNASRLSFPALSSTGTGIKGALHHEFPVSYAFSHQHEIGYQQGSFSYQSDGISVTEKTSSVFYALSGKLWFVNILRLNKVFNAHCAHRYAVLYDKTLKPYLILGAQLEMLTNKSALNTTFGENVNGIFPAAHVGLGTNFLEFKTYNPPLLYLEFRMYQQLTGILNSGYAGNYPFAYQFTLGIKFARD